MTKAQGHDIFSGHRQSMCQVSASNHYPLQNIWPRHELCNFWSDLQLAQTTLGQDHDTPSGHMQSFYGVGTSLVFP